MIYVFLMFFITTFLFNIITVKQTIKYIVPAEYKTIFLAGFIFLTVFFYIYQFCGSYFAGKFSYNINRILSYTAYYYLSFILYSAMVYIIIFFISLFLKGKFNLYPLSFAAVIFILLAGTFFKHNTVITEYEISRENYNLSSPLNIVLISDIHMGYINGNRDLIKLAEKVNTLNPDVVLIAGDVVDMHIEPVIQKNMFDNLQKIKSRYGIFAVLGNHDIYDRKAETITKLLREKGINVVRDEKILVDNKFYVAGRDNFSKTPLSSFLEEGKERPVILMEHTPDRIMEAVENNVFLQVSGHTHKGQIFPGELFTKRIFLLDYGYKKFENTNVIVSSGYGTWGPPIRVGTRSEICVIRIK